MESLKIYVASSWRNEHQPYVVKSLADAGHDVYDFKDAEGFHWSEVDKDYLGAGEQSDGNKDLDRYVQGLSHPRAVQGFNRDFEAMREAKACVLVLPSGRSAHLEAGWFIGQRVPTVIFIPHNTFDGTWELMYKMADKIIDTYKELWTWAGTVSEENGF